jgi:hypothetical protein
MQKKLCSTIFKIFLTSYILQKNLKNDIFTRKYCCMRRVIFKAIARHTSHQLYKDRHNHPSSIMNQLNNGRCFADETSRLFMAVLRRMSCSSNDCHIYFPCCAFITDLYTGAPALIVHTQEMKDLPYFSFFCFLKITLFS